MIAVASVVWNEACTIVDYITRVLELIRRGTVQAWVVLDQSSDDGTWETLLTWRRLVPCWHRFEQRPHAGYCEVHRQESIDLCPTPWVFVLDADEWIDPDAPLLAWVEQAERAGAAAITLPRWNHVVDVPGHPRMMHFGDERHPRVVKRGAVEWPTNAHATPIIRGPRIDADVWLHHRWRLWAQPSKIARQVAFTRLAEGDDAAASLQHWLEENFRAFRRELGVD